MPLFQALPLQLPSFLNFPLLQVGTWAAFLFLARMETVSFFALPSGWGNPRKSNFAIFASFELD